MKIRIIMLTLIITSDDNNDIDNDIKNHDNHIKMMVITMII